MNFTRLSDIFFYQNARFPQKIALASRALDGSWATFSSAECLVEIDKLSAGLLTAGFKKGDRIGILAHAGSPRWQFADLGCQQIGVVTVPIHSTARADEIAFIIEDSGLRGCFVSNQKMLEKLLEAGVFLEKKWSFEPTDGVENWENLACEPSESDQSEIRNRQSEIKETDLATIIYTSGTTGQPKGVMLSHANLVSNIKAILAVAPLTEGNVVASFLPMSHVFERMMSLASISAGCNVYYLDNQSLTLAELKKIRPHFFATVPRFLEKMHGVILGHRERVNPFFGKILDWAIGLGERFPSKGFEAVTPDYYLRLWLADLFVYRRWRRSLGGRVRGIVVGAAALQPKLARLFSAAGIPIREGYGLTETSPVVAINRFEPGGNYFGTVGMAVPGVELRLSNQNGPAFAEATAGEGEIEVRGPNVFMGYLNRPEETAAHFTEDGWLKTGDIGTLVHKRFLKITGRARDIFKTSSGKFVAPQFVENQLIATGFIENALVIGLNRPSVAAIILPDFGALKNWCAGQKIHWTGPQFMLLNPKVERFFEKIISEKNDELAAHERVREYRLVHEPWSAETGELTPTLKLRRDFLMEKYAGLVREMYGEG